MTYFECYADEALLRVVGFSSKNLEHSFGRSRVCAKLYKFGNSLGLIDEDPNKARDPYLTQLYQLRPTYNDSYLIAFDDKKRNNRLVVLRPDLEFWIIKLANESKVDLQEFELPTNGRDLHAMLMLEKNVRKRQAFEDFLRNHLKHRAFEKLKELLSK